MKKEYIVYILDCADSSYYVGLTSNLPQRLWQHESGHFKHCYTAKRRPVQLLHTECYTEAYQATYREKQLKRWSRKKKEALIDGNQDYLAALSVRQTSFKTYHNIKKAIRQRLNYHILPNVRMVRDTKKCCPEERFLSQ